MLYLAVYSSFKYWCWEMELDLSTNDRRLLNFPSDFLLLSSSSFNFLSTKSVEEVCFFVWQTNSISSLSISARSSKWSKSLILLNFSFNLLLESSNLPIVNCPLFYCYFLIMLIVFDQKWGLGFFSWLAKTLSIFILICANLYSSAASIFAFLAFDSATRSATFAWKTLFSWLSFTKTALKIETQSSGLVVRKSIRLAC